MKNKPFQKKRSSPDRDDYFYVQRGTETREATWIQPEQIPSWVTPKMLIKVTTKWHQNSSGFFGRLTKEGKEGLNISVTGPFMVLVVKVASDRKSMDVLFGEDLGRIHASKEYELEKVQ